MIRDDDPVPVGVEVFGADEDVCSDDLLIPPRLACGCPAVHPLPIREARDGTEYCISCTNHEEDRVALMRRLEWIAACKGATFLTYLGMLRAAADGGLDPASCAERINSVMIRIGRELRNGSA